MVTGSKVGLFSVLLVLAVTFAVPANGTVDGLPENYPSKSITVLIPYGEGGASDRTYHALKPGLDKHFGVETVVKRIGGEAGTVGSYFATRMAPDGYNLFIAPSGPIVIQPHVRDLEYDYTDLEPVARLSNTPVGFMVALDSPFNSVQDVIDAAKANPGGLSYVTAGFGSVPHLVMEAFTQEVGIEMAHVQQSGGTSKVVEVVKNGGAQLFADPMNIAETHGLKLLAVFADERTSQFPDTPTMKELGIDITYSLFFGLYAPKGISAELEEKIADVAKMALMEPEVVAQMNAEKNVVSFLSGDAFDDFVAEESAKNKVFAEQAGL